ncbi:hypothetical protein [Lewinella cohaerens]|uniref:hypothetical protein n=1 Tax=Lewinella cohaerens TaxID=70995 RepID=UPI00036A3A38|nr:hypothetical protein [Lewinella cohaerens]
MGVERIKERLHLRIEQADEQMLQVLVEMTESLFRTYQPQILKEKEADLNKDYTEHLRPLTREELTSEIEESMADYERGDYLPLDESSKEASSW